MSQAPHRNPEKSNIESNLNAAFRIWTCFSYQIHGGPLFVCLFHMFVFVLDKTPWIWIFLDNIPTEISTSKKKNLPNEELLEVCCFQFAPKFGENAGHGNLGTILGLAASTLRVREHNQSSFLVETCGNLWGCFGDATQSSGVRPYVPLH